MQHSQGTERHAGDMTAALEWLNLACDLVLGGLSGDERGGFAESGRATGRERDPSGSPRQLPIAPDYEATLRALVRLFVPRVADSCTFYLRGMEGRVLQFGPAFADPEEAETGELHKPAPVRIVRPEELPPTVREMLEGLQTATTGDYPVHRSGWDPGSEVGQRSTIVVPLRARGRTVGAAGLTTMVSGADGEAEALDTIGELARLAALVVDEVQHFWAERSPIVASEAILHSVSRDLRGSVHAIMLGTDSLLRHWPPQGSGLMERKQLEVVHASVRQVFTLTCDLLEIGRIRTGQLVLRAAPVAPIRLVEEATRAARPLADEKGCTLEPVVPGVLPAVRADRERILRVFANLLAYAVQASPPERPIRISAERIGEDRVCFSVLAPGIWIEPDAPLYLFDPVRQSQTAPGTASGLGLVVARALVEEHGGSIWAESRRPTGGAFLFTLPIAGSAG